MTLAMAIVTKLAYRQLTVELLPLLLLLPLPAVVVAAVAVVVAVVVAAAVAAAVASYKWNCSKNYCL